MLKIIKSNLIKFKNLNILEILIILSPFIDVITSLMVRFYEVDISLGLIVRMMFLLFMIYFLFVKSKSKYKKLSIIFVCLFMVYCISFLVIMYITKNRAVLFTELKSLVKTFYFPICLIAIFNYIDTKKENFNFNILVCTSLIYMLLVVIPNIIGYGFSAYNGSSMGGVNGWFYAANEIGAIFAILMPIIIFSYQKFNKKIIYLIIVMFSSYTMLQMGTKVPMLCVIIAILSFIIFHTLGLIFTKDKEKTKILLFSIGMILIIAPILITSPAAKRLNLKINDLLSNNSENKLTKEDYDLIVLSDRVFKKNEIKKRAQNSPLVYRVMGTGYIYMENYSKKDTIDEERMKEEVLYKVENMPENMTEMDYHDIYYNYGIVGVIVYFSGIIIMLWYIVIKIIKNIKKYFLQEDIYASLISIIMAIGVAYLAGHVFFAPAVSIYLAIIVANLLFIMINTMEESNDKN